MRATIARRLARYCAAALIAAPIAALADEDPEDKTDFVLRVIGQTAEVAILDDDLVIEAKVDTGADSTSLDARDIEPFERDGDEWVRFTVPIADGESVRFERRVAETVRIRRAGEGVEERYVVEMHLCVGDVSLPTEVNLANREGLDYRMLIGRGFLVRGRFLVNPAQGSSHAPRCSTLMDG